MNYQYCIYRSQIQYFCHLDEDDRPIHIAVKFLSNSLKFPLRFGIRVTVLRQIALSLGLFLMTVASVHTNLI